MKRLLVTAALPYSNGRLHVGHLAGSYLPADIYVRFQRLIGREVTYVCGSDDHGVAIMLSAEKEGKTPAEVAEYYNQRQVEDFAGVGITFDVYGSTSRTECHQEFSQGFFRSLYDKGFFEKKSSQQFYDEKAKMFLPDRYVEGTCAYCDTPGQHGDQCENCGKVLDVEHLKDAKSVVTGEPAVVRDTVHWFLDLSRFEKHVADWLEGAALRDHTRKYVRGLLASGLVKRSMTRDIDWGIPVPLDDPEAQGKVLYVWFDAPIGYISNTLELCAKRDGDSGKYVDWWKSPDTEILHFIGEDNTIFHCVIWIAMLNAEGTFQLPRGVIVNQFLNMKFPDREAEKISKSRGNAIWIGDFLEKGGNPDALRYYLTLVAPEKARTVFKPDDLVQRNNSELANALGNFVNRIVSFTRKYCGPEKPYFPAEKIQDVDHEFLRLRQENFEKVTALLEEFSFKQALETVMEFARACNRYVDEKAPWQMRKTDLEGTQVTLAYALDAIRYLGVVLFPFLPFTAAKICHMLELDPDEQSWNSALEGLAAGHALSEPEILFTKMEVDEWV